MGEGVTQIVYDPIKTFQWQKPITVEARTVKEKKNRRDWVLWSIVVAAFFAGTGLGCMADDPLYAVPILVASIGWLCAVAIANRR